MSGNPADPRLLGLVAPDEAFRQAARAFMLNNAPTAHAVHLRQDLEHFVAAFFSTSQDVNMQELLLMLHNGYNLDWLVDEALIPIIQFNVIALQGSRGAHYTPVATDLPNQHPSSATPGLTPPLQSRPTDGSNEYRSLHNSIQDEAVPRQRDRAETQPAPLPAADLIRCHPPNLSQTKISITDSNWTYQCDLCGHCSKRGDCFNRHFRLQGVRSGFKVISTEIDATSARWYAVDTAGNEYMGNVVPYTQENQRMQPPCRHRVAAGIATERKETDRRKTERADNLTSSHPLPRYHHLHDPNRCHPPNLEHKVIVQARDPNWKYMCDKCGRAIRYRDEFVRHIRRHIPGQPGFRIGFRVVHATPETAPVWYGIDREGSEYMGHMILDPGAEGSDRPDPTRISKPGEPPIDAARKAKERAKVTGKGANIAKNDEDEDEEDEDEKGEEDQAEEDQADDDCSG